MVMTMESEIWKYDVNFVVISVEKSSCWLAVRNEKECSLSQRELLSIWKKKHHVTGNANTIPFNSTNDNVYDNRSGNKFRTCEASAKFNCEKWF